ncbi:hypothetical protein V8D89_007488 [Ganoderma adspersum]
MEFMSLPSELLITIFINLHLKDFLRCRQVCTRFQSLIDRDFRTTYKLELAVAGMQDGPPSTRTTADRLSILQARHDAWSKFAWTAKENVPMYQGYAPEWELYGNVLAQWKGGRTLHFKQILSVIRGIEGIEWVIPDVGCQITGIGMDPSQDLLVVIEHFWNNRSEFMCRIHLKALSTGAPHPAGPMEGTLTHNYKLRSHSYSTQMSDNHLGILMVYAGCIGLLVWDWKIGAVCLHITAPEITSWAFLTSRFLLVAQTDSKYNEENGSTVYIPHVVVIDLESAPSPNRITLSEANSICAFHYPPITDNVLVVGMAIRSDPGPNSCLSPSLNVPFSVSSDPEHRLFLISLQFVIRGHNEGVVLGSLVPAATFLRALATVAPGQTRRDSAWSEWGERGSRLFSTPGTHASDDACNAYGTVFATTEVDSDTPDGRVRMTVTVRDFNQLAIRRRAADRESGRKHSEREGEEQDARVVADVSVLEPTGVFKEEVKTSLPYTERVLVLFQEGQDAWDAAIPTEDALVLATGARNSRFRYRILSI